MADFALGVLHQSAFLVGFVLLCKLFARLTGGRFGYYRKEDDRG